ncbi:MAG: response regulator, partial [Nisaea sp.]|nr:response regulator [Nisaea sp.]
TNQLVIRQMLNKMGFACEIADNGRVALSMLEQEGYGLLLSDVNMPEMDGYALTGEIRRREAGGEGERGQDRALPIIALTADALPGTEEACLEAGMDGFLTKPIDSRKLGQVLARFLPQALPLRRAADQPVDVAAEPAMEIDWDRDIFDPMVLGGPAGGLDREARELLASAAESWQGKLDDIGR